MGWKPPASRRLAVALEDDRGRGVAHRAVGGRGLALELGRRARRGARQRAIGLVGLDDVGVVDARHDRRRVEPGDAAQAGGEVAVLVEHERRRELHELQRAEGGVAERRVLHAGGDDGAARARGGRHVVLGLRLERHPVLAEVAIAAGLALGRVAAVDVLLGALGQPDEGELPVELGAVAPAQRGQRRRGRVGPRAAGVGEVPDGDRLHEQHCGTSPPPARRRRCGAVSAVARGRALARRPHARRCHARRAEWPRCRSRRPRRLVLRARSVEHRARAPWPRSPPSASPWEG